MKDAGVCMFVVMFRELYKGFLSPFFDVLLKTSQNWIAHGRIPRQKSQQGNTIKIN